jgi:methionyl-tRNA synthetase
MSDNRFYITTPIYYPNAEPHLGAAYTDIACDVLARFNRLDGKDVLFLTGTDDHGQKIAKAAEAAGVDPQTFTDGISVRFKQLAEALNCTNDDFIRTTEERHKAGVRALWQKLQDNGQIYLGKYAGWYAVRDEAFYGEEELTVMDGKHIAPSGAECAWVEEPSYFFKLSEWGGKLLAYYDAHPDFIMPVARRNEVISFVRGGLRDLSISRTSFTWGIPVPGDEQHIMYVWIDALANYITALGYPEKTKKYSTFWPADYHVVGKDIVRFHAVYWPAFLLAAGLPVPRHVFAHGWWTAEGEKMSKSLGNVIVPADLISTYGLDQTRYFLLRAFPFGNDGDFSRKAMIERINGDLANGIGNLAQRTLSFIAKNAGGVMPKLGNLSSDDEALLFAGKQLPELVRLELGHLAFHKALDAIFAVVGEADSYIDRQAPWTLRKTDTARMETVLAVLCQTLRVLATVLQPFMPATMNHLLDQLGVPADARQLAALAEPIATGTALPGPEGLFPRYVEDPASAG